MLWRGLGCDRSRVQRTWWSPWLLVAGRRGADLPGGARGLPWPGVVREPSGLRLHARALCRSSCSCWASLAGLGRRAALLAAGIFGLFILQSVFVGLRADAPEVAALHPVNGFLITFLSIVLARDAWLGRRAAAEVSTGDHVNEALPPFIRAPSTASAPSSRPVPSRSAAAHFGNRSDARPPVGSRPGNGGRSRRAESRATTSARTASTSSKPAPRTSRLVARSRSTASTPSSSATERCMWRTITRSTVSAASGAIPARSSQRRARAPPATSKQSSLRGSVVRPWSWSRDAVHRTWRSNVHPSPTPMVAPQQYDRTE